MAATYQTDTLSTQQAIANASYQLVIIGAGPAGLSLAHELKRRGLDCLLLERGHCAGFSWENMRRNLCLGPWKTNWLPGTRTKLRDAYRATPREAFVHYLRSYAQIHELRIRMGVEVTGVEKTNDDRFVIHTNRGNYITNFLVSATGYFSKPHVPPIPGQTATAIPQIHAAGFRDTSTVERILEKHKGRILIVGKRLTAGEIMLELYDAGYEIALSCRGAIEFGHSLPVQRLAAPLYFFVEDLAARLQSFSHHSSLRLMDGGRSRRLIRTRRVLVFPRPQCFTVKAVRFEDGRVEGFDLIIYATGYRPALDYLADLVTCDPLSGKLPMVDMESEEVPNLFFLGFDQERNFRSRFIRGIREDAAYLAAKLSHRLGGPTRKPLEAMSSVSDCVT